MTPPPPLLLALDYETAMAIFWIGVAAATGLVIGSFLNVVIWRLPRGVNLSRPPSSCPGCGHGIRWFDNIPVFSWALLLRGRCRGCRMRISVRYPLVELLTGVLFALVAVRFAGDAPTIVIVGLATAAFVAISFIDLDLRIIPDRISKPGMVFGIVTAPFAALFALRHPDGWLVPGTPWLDALLYAMAGCAAGALVILVVRVVGGYFLKKEAMGLGDLKLLAMIGAFVGPLHAVFTLVLGSLGGALVGGLWFLIGKRRPMPAGVIVTRLDDEQVATFERVRIRGTEVRLQGAPEAAVGTRVRLDLTLPATRILEDEDAEVRVRGKLVACTPGTGGHTWLIEADAPKGGRAAQLAAERIEMFSYSYKYIPFGPFLVLGGLALLYFGPEVEWFIRVGYPEWVRGVMDPAR